MKCDCLAVECLSLRDSWGAGPSHLATASGAGAAAAIAFGNDKQRTRVDACGPVMHIDPKQSHQLVYQIVREEADNA